jgi:hypothetical protein
MCAGCHAKRSVSVFGLTGQPIARFDHFVVFVGGSMQPPHLQRSNASKGIHEMPPAHQQQKRLLLLLKRGRWPYYAAIILIACAFWLWHLWFD